jgi:hypothetical protein
VAGAIPLVLAPVDRVGCPLQEATVAFVPPDTWRVIAAYRCADGPRRHLTCWERWTETGAERRRLGASRSCEISGSDGIETDGSRPRAGESPSLVP